MQIKPYYLLTKPGIIYGNAITAVAGFLLASKSHLNFSIFFGMLFGTSLIIASGCVFNNYIDRDMDAKMQRTKKRSLVTGKISVRNAIMFGLILGILGFTILAIFTNWLTVIIGIVGIVDYVILYGIFKRSSVHGTIVGSIAGATPIVAGYTSVTNSFDIGAFLLFLILVTWQMPHFYAIAMYRLKDYDNAGIPVLPVKNGIFITKIQMALYIIAFIIATLMLTIKGFTGNIYFVLASLLGIGWLGLNIYGFTTKNDTQWARKMFFASLIIILSLSLLLSVDSVLH